MKSRLFGRRKPTVERKSRQCWFCSRALGNNFTSVQKNDQTLHVHFACRPEAAVIAAGAVIVEDNPDTFVTGLPIG